MKWLSRAPKRKVFIYTKKDSNMCNLYQMGKEGWELVAVQDPPHRERGLDAVYYFKKEKME